MGNLDVGWMQKCAEKRCCQAGCNNEQASGRARAKEIGPKDSILPTGLREKAKMLLEQRETWKHTSLGCLLLLFAWNVLPPDIQMARSFTYFEFF